MTQGQYSLALHIGYCTYRRQVQVACHQLHSHSLAFAQGHRLRSQIKSLACGLTGSQNGLKIVPAEE